MEDHVKTRIWQVLLVPFMVLAMVPLAILFALVLWAGTLIHAILHLARFLCRRSGAQATSWEPTPHFLETLAKTREPNSRG